MAEITAGRPHPVQPDKPQPTQHQTAGWPCVGCGSTGAPLHPEMGSGEPERVGGGVVRDSGRCIDCVVNGR